MVLKLVVYPFHIDLYLDPGSSHHRDLLLDSKDELKKKDQTIYRSGSRLISH